MAEFFIKLQDIVNLEESIEGIRDILLAVYRNGSISIKNISRVTKIPIPAVSKVVNILIEREVLTRPIDGKGVQFWERSMNFVEEHFKFYGYGVQQCPECRGRPNFLSPRFENLFDELNPIFENRPQVDTTCDQSKNTVETGIQRVLYFYNEGGLEGKNVLFIGDDDFTSAVLSIFYKSFFPKEPKLLPRSVSIVDIDERILNSISNIYDKNKLSVNCTRYDLKDPIPDDLLGKFDTIITDPPYSINGVKLFLSRAISMMPIIDKYNTGKDIFLSFAHRSPQRTLKLQSLLTEMGLSIMEIIPRFNIYEGSEVLGNQTQMFHLKTTLETKPLILPDVEYKEAIYTGESHPYVRTYKCKNCNHTIEVGPDREFTTIEILKGNKCPKCESKNFDLVSRNLDILD